MSIDSSKTAKSDGPGTPCDPATTPESAAATDPADWADTAFARLLGRQPTEQERARLHHIRETLDLGANDALWVVLIALQYHLTLYERFPPMIKNAAHQLLTELKMEADTRTKQAALELQFAVRDLKQPLADAVQAASDAMRSQLVDASRKAAEQAMRRARLEKSWPWLLAGGASVALALVLSISVALSYGRREGYATGFEVAAHQFRDRPPPPQPSSPSSSGARGR